MALSKKPTKKNIDTFINDTTSQVKTSIQRQ